MKLSVRERLALLKILPKEEDLTMLKVMRELRESLSFSEEELTELNFRRKGEDIAWDEKIAPKDILLGNAAKKVVCTYLERTEYYSLYRKFFEPKEVTK